LGLGPVALALCGASGPEWVERVDALLAEHGDQEFADRFFRDAGLDWAAAQGFEQLVTVSADAQVPSDLVARLQEAAAQAGPVPVVAAKGEDRVPAVALWPVVRTESLRSALATGQRDVSALMDALGAVELPLDGPAQA
ncbi:MAG: hypothetical protein ACU0DY_02960, partial [Citreimonas sp.]